MLGRYKSGPKKRHQEKSARLQVVVLQARRQLAVSFELDENSQVSRVSSRFVPGRMTSEYCAGKSPVLESPHFFQVRFTVMARCSRNAPFYYLSLDASLFHALPAWRGSDGSTLLGSADFRIGVMTLRPYGKVGKLFFCGGGVDASPS